MNKFVNNVNWRYSLLAGLLFFVLSGGALRNVYAQTTTSPRPTPCTLGRQACDDADPNFFNPQKDYQDTVQNGYGAMKDIFKSFGGDSHSEVTPGQDNASVSGNTDLNFTFPDPLGLTKCQSKIDGVLAQLEAHKENIAIYQEASKQTGVPWEVLAAIHYIEANFRPTGSLVSGRELGTHEPDIERAYGSRDKCPEQYKFSDPSGQGFYCGFQKGDLLGSAIYAANLFLGKEKTASNLIAREGQTNLPNLEFRRIAAAFALYNGPGNAQCDGNSPKSNSHYSGCPSKFYMDDHLYPMACYDDSHADMYLIYCGDGSKCSGYVPYQRIGAMALIYALNKKYGGFTDRGVGTISSTAHGSYKDLIYYPQCASNPGGPYGGAEYSYVNATMPQGCTICKAGCGMTTTSMIVSSYADPSYNPLKTMGYYQSKGYMLGCDGSTAQGAQSTIRDVGAGKIDVASQWVPVSKTLQQSTATLKGFLNLGKSLMVLGLFKYPNEGSFGHGHFYWIVEIDDNDNVWTLDPYYGRNQAPPLNMSAIINTGAPYKDAYIQYVLPISKK